LDEGPDPFALLRLPWPIQAAWYTLTILFFIWLWYWYKYKR